MKSPSIHPDDIARLQDAIAGPPMTSPWIPVSDRLPPDGEVVLTKIDDDRGCRNEAMLKRIGRLWFFADGSMYVYYVPTHWAVAPESAKGGPHE